MVWLVDWLSWPVWLGWFGLAALAGLAELASMAGLVWSRGWLHGVQSRHGVELAGLTRLAEYPATFCQMSSNVFQKQETFFQRFELSGNVIWKH